MTNSNLQRLDARSLDARRTWESSINISWVKDQHVGCVSLWGLRRVERLDGRWGDGRHTQGGNGAARRQNGEYKIFMIVILAKLKNQLLGCVSLRLIRDAFRDWMGAWVTVSILKVVTERPGGKMGNKRYS